MANSYTAFNEHGPSAIIILLQSTIDSVVDKDSVVYQIQEDPINGTQPHDDHGVYLIRHSANPGGAHVASAARTSAGLPAC